MKKLGVILILLTMPAMVFANGKTIVWVSDAHMTDTANPGVPDDQGWVDFLTSLGFVVDYPKGSGTTGYYQTLDSTKLAQLEAADLIIMSRDVSSGGYSTDDTERGQWGSITTPLILMSCYLARSGNGRWFNSTAVTARNDYNRLRATAASDPLFEHVLLDGNNDTVVYDTSVWPGYWSFIGTGDAGNGRVLAARPDNGWVLIAEWDPGKPFYNATPNVMVGGKRMFFNAGTQESDGNRPPASVGWGKYNLTPAGEQMFVNALKRYLGDFYYNAVPQVDAGSYQVASLVGGAATVQLDARAKDDGNPYGIILYSWEQVAGPAAASLSDSKIAAPVVGMTARGIYDFRVTVWDYDPNAPGQAGKSASDTVRVRVKDPALDDVLLGHWQFEEGTGKTTNDSAGANDVGTLGSVSGDKDPNWVDGWVGDYALEFYGTSWVTLANATTDANAVHMDNLRHEITTAAWVKVDAFTNPWASIFGKWNTTWRLARRDQTNGVTLHLSGVQESIAGTRSVNTGYWHHVAGTYDGQRVVIYVDGEVDAVMQVSGLINLDSDPARVASIGNRMDNTANRGWHGKIDDVRLYSYAISAEEVAALARLGRNVVPRVNAGPDRSLLLTDEDSIVIDAVGTDLNGDALNYRWTVIGPDDVEFIPNANVEKPTVRFRQKGTYTFRVAVDDGMAGLEGDIWDEVVVTVTSPTCAEIIAQGLGLVTDLNQDCRVDLLDLAMLAADWLRCYDPQDVDCENPFKW